MKDDLVCLDISGDGITAFACQIYCYSEVQGFCLLLNSIVLVIDLRKAKANRSYIRLSVRGFALDLVSELVKAKS